MAEINKNELEEIKKAVGFDEDKGFKGKDVNIIKDKKQFSIRIPKKFVDLLGIDETEDHFRFYLIPNEDVKEKFDLEAILVRG